MRHSITTREFSFTLVLLFLFVSSVPRTWSQSTPPQSSPSPSTSASTSAPAAVPPPAGTTPAGATKAPGTGGSALSIGGGDLLKVSVFGAPESDQEVRVDPDGNVTLNFIGSVHLGGLSHSEAQTLIETQLSTGGAFSHPQATASATVCAN